MNSIDALRLAIWGNIHAIDVDTGTGITYVWYCNTASIADKTKAQRKIQKIETIAWQTLVSYPLLTTAKGGRFYDESYSYIWEDRATLNRETFADVF